MEEKASGSGDVRTDLQEALAASVAVAPEPVPKPKPKKMPGKGGFMSYDPPRLIRDAPINQDVKGGKGGKGERIGDACEILNEPNELQEEIG